MNKKRSGKWITKLNPYSIILGFLSLFLGACSNDHADLKQYIYFIKHKPKKSDPLFINFEATDELKWSNNILKRNLFNAKKRIRTIKVSTRKKQTLEAFSLRELQFVGTIKGDTVYALIKQPDNTIVRVRPGDYLGKNNGHILLIEENRIKLSETINHIGKVFKQITILDLNMVSKVDAS